MLESAWTAKSVASLPPSLRERLLANLTDEEKAALVYDWSFWARPAQLPPEGDWRTWLCLSGRGFGKTRTGAEWCRAQVESGRCRRLALVAPTAADARDIMVEGESGILSVSPPWNRPLYEPTKRRLTWPNGAMATTYSAEEPERLRGPQHDSAWCDEMAAWVRPETWDQLLFGLRLGDDPRVVVTTTPRPTALIKGLKAHLTTVTTGGTSYENAGNLAPAFLEAVIARYEGTRLGRQELLAHILEDNPGALFRRDQIEADRVDAHPDLARVVVGIDPAVSSGEDAAETGIVIAGVHGTGTARQFYVLADLSRRTTPRGWALAATQGYDNYRCDRIVAETNNGGEMVEETLRNVSPQVSYKAVHASRGKVIRAEPIAALYEQHRVHHMGFFPALEDQLCEWVPGEPSPDRLDALVWALSELSQGNTWLPTVSLTQARDRGDLWAGSGSLPAIRHSQDDIRIGR